MPKITLAPYLFFTGNCQEGMEFYKSIFGGELQVMPDNNGRVMHANLAGGVIDLMASDGSRTTPYEAGPISLTLSGTDLDQLTAIFKALSEGGKVTSDLKPESWGDTFGSLTDKFGFDWQVNVGTDKE